MLYIVFDFYIFLRKCLYIRIDTINRQGHTRMNKQTYPLCIIFLLTISLSVQGLSQCAFSDTDQQDYQLPSSTHLPKDNYVDIAVLNTNWESVGILLNDQNDGFHRVVNYTTEGLALGICAGDFNADLKNDIAVCDIVDGLITILLGDGQGAFTKHQTFTGGRYPQEIITFDVNQDGYLDLLTTLCYEEQIRIFLGDGTGTFSYYYNISAGDCPYALTSGDLNNDDCLDLVVTDYDVAEIIVFKGDGTGNFTQVAQLPSEGLYPEHIEIQDYNNDEYQDIAVLNKYFDGPLTVYLGDGQFVFSDPIITDLTGVPKCFCVEDFDQDTIRDIAFTDSYHNKICIYKGVGDGSFKNHLSYPVGNNPWGVTTEYLNGDKFADLVVANFGVNKSVSVLYATDKAEFEDRREYPVGYGPTKVVIDQFNQGAAPSSPQIKGPVEGEVNTPYQFTISSIDPDEDQLSYYIDWGDNTFLDWQGEYDSGEEVLFTHTWDEEGSFTIRVKARDSSQFESEWSTRSVSMPHHSVIPQQHSRIFHVLQQLFSFIEARLKIL